MSFHAPEHHFLSRVFEGAEKGLKPPERWNGTMRDIPFAVARTAVGLAHSNTLVCTPGALFIQNLDRADPPGYDAEHLVPRGSSFNRNVFSITSQPNMPSIKVECGISGFNPAVTPILWRLEAAHPTCRYSNMGHYTYQAACEMFKREWQGKSTAKVFTLFDPADRNVSYDYGSATDDVMGGHAILSVYARPVQSERPFADYVHLRIVGTNPTKEDVLRFLGPLFEGRDENLRWIARAIFAHESHYKQFSETVQSQTRFTITAPRHGKKMEGQPDCILRFDWPDDPPDFPLISFDFGIGISQYTRLRRQAVSADMAWDWRSNLLVALNLMLDNAERLHVEGASWREWAFRIWASYNGGTPYARTLAQTDDGKLVSDERVPSKAKILQQLYRLPLPDLVPPGPAWPPE